MRNPSPSALAVLTLFAAVSPSSLSAQETALDRDMRFVRGLAKDLGFIEVAQREVEGLHQDASSSSDQRAVSLLGIEVAMYGAKGYSDRVKQRALYEDALNQAREIIDQGDEKTAQRARLILADATYEFGRFLVDELQLARDTDPARVPELEEAAAKAFRDGVEVCDRAMNQLAGEIEDDDEKRVEHGLTWMRKGILLREQARAVKADRAYLAQRARDTLEELIFEWGEESALGLRAMFEYSQVDEVTGDLRSATSYYKDTISGIQKTIKEQDLPPETVQFLLDMAQEVFAALMRAEFEGGDTEKVLATAQEFRAFLKENGEPGADILDIAHARHGHEAFLTEARAKAESGQTNLVSEAMEMAKVINDRHPNDVIGLMAKSVIEKVVEAQSGLVSGDVLFEIAKGEYQNKNYEPARNAIKRALTVMTEQEANALGMEAWYMMGTSFAIESRYLESVMAYNTGLTQFGPSGNEWVERTTDRLDQASSQLKRQTKNDPALSDLHATTENLLREYAGAESVDKLAWKDGNRLMASEEFSKAAESYAKITKSYLYYDLARARYAYALALAGKRDEARRVIDEFRAYLESPEGAIPEDKDKAGKEQVRAQSIAELDYRGAFMDYREAVGSVPGVEKDLARYPAIIDKFKAFLSNHSEAAPNFVPYALDAVGRMQAEIGQLDKAEEAYRRLQSSPDGVSLAAKLSTVIFLAWKQELDNREKEYEAAARAGKTERELQPQRESVDAAHRKVLSLGREYARGAAEPQYGVLVHTLSSAKALGDWQQVEEVANKTIQVWGEHPDTKDKVDAFVRPAVGEAALRKGEYQQAFDMLSAAEAANPRNYEIKRLICLSLGGWLEFDQRSGNPILINGLGEFDKAYDKWYGEYKAYGERAGVERYSLEWFEFQWQAYYFASRAKSIDSKYGRFADTLLQKARSIDNWASLEAHGPRGQELKRMFLTPLN